MSTEWVGWCCSYCAKPLSPWARGLHCTAEDRFFTVQNGVHRLLPEDRVLAALAFSAARRPHGSDGAAPELGRALKLARRHLGRGRWRVLEIGAGPCLASVQLLERGHQVAAVDVEVDGVHGLGAAQRHLPPGRELPRAQAEWDALPLEPASFDLVLSVAGLHRTPDLGRLLGELRRVTRKGGVFLALGSVVSSGETPTGTLALAELPRVFGESGWMLELHPGPGPWTRLLHRWPRKAAVPRLPILLARRPR